MSIGRLLRRSVQRQQHLSSIKKTNMADNYDLEAKRETRLVIKWSTLGVITLLFIIVCGMFGCPKWRVWQQGLQGQAELKRAEQNRQITIQEAMAKKESANNLSQADTIRAHGIARANQIIGKSLTPAYLHWFWIDNIDKSNNVIYVPTEANLPIMEASRFFNFKDSLRKAE